MAFNIKEKIKTFKDLFNEEERTKKKLAKKEKKALYKQREKLHYEMVNWQIEHEKDEKKAPVDSVISLQHINKIYPNHVQAVSDFNLEIKEHEFIVFVGPSGCGKSTTLRMIAGLEDITAGDLYIAGKYANDLMSKERDIAMVFQNYALYPNMNVYDNLAFSLRCRKIPDVVPLKQDKSSNDSTEEDTSKQVFEDLETNSLNENSDEQVKHIMRKMTEEEVKERVMEVAKTLELEEYLDRKPAELSGGQRQRVALGRAIVRNAKVFLMDEPLSNLDAKLRVQMRGEIVKLHKAINTTTIYVTHDQIEAMTMADRIVVMKKGVVQQIGSPKEIYNHPSNIFVATFIGSPAMNIVSCHYRNGILIFDDNFIIVLDEEFIQAHDEFYKNEIESAQSNYDNCLNDYNMRLDFLKNGKDKKYHTDDIEVLLQDPLLYAYQRTLDEAKEKLDTLVGYKDDHEIYFGIRPEDIVSGKSMTLIENQIEGIKLPINLAELLGNEYYIHSTFGNQDIIAKAAVNQNLNAGVTMEAIFNKDHIHIFDKLTEKLIK